MAESISRPSIEIDSYVDEERASAIRSMDRMIHNRPNSFARAIEAMQEQENGLSIESLDLSEARRSRPQVERLGRTALPQTLITEAMRLRLDTGFDYDDLTEKAIEEDPVQAELLTKPKDMGVVLVKTGIMRSAMRSHPEAASVRDQLRLNRLYIYASRVALFNSVARREHSERLRSAG